MDDNSDTFDIAKMCKAFDLPRSSFYNFKNNIPSNGELQKQNVKTLINQIWLDSSKRYGAPLK